MRKYLVTVILIFCMLLFSSCSGKDKEAKGGEEKEKFNNKIAMNVTQNYMKYIMSGDMENANKLYAKDISEKNKGTLDSDLKIVGYRIDEVNGMGEAALIKIKVSRSVKDIASAALDTYNIKIVKEKDEYKIKDISATTEKEAFQEGQTIRMRQKNNIKTNLVIDQSGIPHYTFSKNDKARVSKLQIPKDKFGNINFSYSGDKLAFTTYDKNSYAAIIKIDESLAVQGQNGGMGGGGAGTQGGGQPTQTGPREKPIGKEIVSLDILKDTMIHQIYFSQDEKFVVIQFEDINKNLGIKIYNVDSGELIPANLEDQFPLNKYNIIFYSFDTDVINFEIRQKGESEKNSANQLGIWQISLKDFKMKKL